ncbi:MAG: hypothetical protein ACI4WS_00935 [Oscillospiraceae bacterium]
MTDKEIVLMAQNDAREKRRTVLPKDFGALETMLYQQIYYLCRDYDEGNIPKDMARHLKKQYISEYDKVNLKLRDFTAAAENEQVVVHTHMGISVPCKITGVLTRFSKDKGWTYSLELREVNSFCVIMADLEEVEVQE